MEATSSSDACRPVQLDVFVGSALRSVPEVQLVELALPTLPTVPTP